MTSPTPNRTEDEGRGSVLVQARRLRRVANYLAERNESEAGAEIFDALKAICDVHGNTVTSAEDSAYTAAAEIARLTQERDRAEQNETFTASRSAEIERHYAVSQSAVSALRERVARLEEALRPFAAIKPSSLYRDDGSEREPYGVMLGRTKEEADFTGADLARARAALNDGDSNAV